MISAEFVSTYRATPKKVNGMTLGAFTGYFRDRASSKNTLYPYQEYEKHFVFGIIYSRTDISNIEKYLCSLDINMTLKLKKLFIAYINEPSDKKWSDILKVVTLEEKHRKVINSFLINETDIYTLDNFREIQSVVKDFEFFIQEKWKIAIDRAGSGNTKNIGSETDIERLKFGKGLFVREFGEKGKKIFDNYWINYETRDMARKVGRDKPSSNNITTYMEWINL